MTATANHELSITRLIDAPPEVVYRVWTERTGEWWAGARRDRMPNEGVFLEVARNEKIVFTNAFAAGWIPQDPFMVVIVTFEPEGSGTRYAARVRHWTAEALKRHEAMGFHEGWGIVAGQLAELAEAEAKSNPAVA